MIVQIKECEEGDMILNEPTITNRDAFSAQFSPRKLKKIFKKDSG